MFTRVSPGHKSAEPIVESLGIQSHGETWWLGVKIHHAQKSWDCDYPQFRFSWILGESLVGGWATPLKNMKVNWDDDIPNIWKNKSRVAVTTNQIIYIYKNPNKSTFFLWFSYGFPHHLHGSLAKPTRDCAGSSPPGSRRDGAAWPRRSWEIIEKWRLTRKNERKIAVKNRWPFCWSSLLTGQKYWKLGETSP